MADRYEGFEQSSRKRGIRFDGKRVSLHYSREARRVYANEAGVARTERDDAYDIQVVCDLCGLPIDVAQGEYVQVLDYAYHRDRCSRGIIDEIIEVELDKPGTFDSVTMVRVYSLRDELRRGERGFFRRLIEAFRGSP